MVKFNALIPEFAVTDVAGSLAFYVGVLEFAVEYERPLEGFAFLSLGEAQIMLDQIGLGRTFETAALERPLGRGCNLQIEVSSETLETLMDKLAAAGIDLLLPLEECWYSDGSIENGVRQFAVADPDGYILRFSTSIGAREKPR